MSEVFFQTDHVGVNGDQNNFRTRAYDDQHNVVGSLEYSEWHGVVNVLMIAVIPIWQRHGIGRTMLLDLQKRYPDTEIDLGMLTGDGQAFIDRMPVKMIEDPSAETLRARLAHVRARLRYYSENAGRMKVYPLDWNDLHDEESEIIDQLNEIGSAKRIFI